MQAQSLCGRRFIDIIEWCKLSDVIKIIIKDNNNCVPFTRDMTLTQ